MDTLFVGRNIIEADTLPSTNSHAMQLIKENRAVEGTVVWTHFQTKGRGQVGNTWVSEKGKNLTFSLVLHPTFLVAEKQFYLSKIASLAVLGMLTEYLPASQYDIQIKWPNDILVNKKKIAGILIESILRSNHLQSSVLGIGLNLNQEVFDGLDKATSLAKLTGKPFEIRPALELFCKHFEAQYLSVKQGRFAQVDKMYLQNLFQLNVTSSYRLNNVVFEAKITGISEGGLLLLTKADGSLVQCNFKESQFL